MFNLFVNIFNYSLFLFHYLSHEICSKYDKKSIAIPFIEPFRIRSRDWEEFDLFVTRDECFDHNFWPRSKRLSLMLMTHDDKQIWKKYNVWYATSHGRVLIGSLIILERRFISLHRVHFSFFSARGGIGISYRISRARLKKKKKEKRKMVFRPY